MGEEVYEMRPPWWVYDPCECQRGSPWGLSWEARLMRVTQDFKWLQGNCQMSKPRCEADSLLICWLQVHGISTSSWKSRVLERDVLPTLDSIKNKQHLDLRFRFSWGYAWMESNLGLHSHIIVEGRLFGWLVTMQSSALQTVARSPVQNDLAWLNCVLQHWATSIWFWCIVVEGDVMTGLLIGPCTSSQLYKLREEKYVLDFQKLTGPQFLFLDLVGNVLSEVRLH